MVKYIDNKLLFGKLPHRLEDSNKATFGKILNIAGSKNYVGAAYLSSISAFRVGAGFISLACPQEIVPIIASMLPEATYTYLNSVDGCISSNNIFPNLITYNVISIGCGLSVTEETSKFVIDFLKLVDINQKIVIDADAINILSKLKEKISLKNAVITPHPLELSRFLNVPIEEILSNREKFARIASQTYDCVTVLKGKNTIVTNGDDIYVNTTGSSALAKAGSGDVLTGIISGLLAQGMSLIDSAVMGVYLHGLSGDLASEELTKYSVLATDTIDYLPFAIDTLITKE